MMFDLKAIRKEQLGLTQDQLAVQLGVTQGTISRLEAGELPMDARTKLAVEALASRATREPQSEAQAA